MLLYLDVCINKGNF